MEKTEYDYYSNVYRGNVIPPEDFGKFERKARSYVDNLIFGRNTAEHQESVKLAVCNVAELLWLEESRAGISAENSDGYSVSYGRTDMEKSIADAAAVYLVDSGLMYAGGR